MEASRVPADGVPRVTKPPILSAGTILALVAFRLAVWDEQQPLAGRVVVSYTRGAEHGPTHFSAHAIIQQVSADR